MKGQATIEDLVQTAPNAVIGRGGDLDDFNEEKVADGIFEAAKMIGGHDPELAKAVARKVRNRLPAFMEKGVYKNSQKRVPSVADVLDATERVLREEDYDNTANCFAIYRKQRELVREVKQKLQVSGDQKKGDTTDHALLLVDTLAKGATAGWDRSRIEIALVNETDLTPKEAKKVAKAVENKILLGEYRQITTNLIKEIVNAELLARGYTEALKGQELLGMSVHDLEAHFYQKSVENSNITANNPEATNMAIAEDTKKKYALKKVFSPDVAKAHLEGKIHLHDLGMIDRVYCSSHSLVYIAKYGLQLDNLQSSSSPAQHALTLVGHLNTTIASMQAYYAGALGVGYINVDFAPYLDADLKSEESIFDAIQSFKSELQELAKTKPELESLIADELKNIAKIVPTKERLRKVLLKQVAQYMIYSGAQNAFSRGGQTVFLDFNVHAGIPEYRRNVPAIGPGGKYMIRDKDGNIKDLEEIKKDGNLKELKLEDRLVFTEEWVEKNGQKVIEQKWINLQEGEKGVVYGDYEQVAQEFAMAMLEVWQKGDRRGAPFAFPKCDFHVDELTFTDEGQKKVLDKACEVASVNGSTYFVFDRSATTMSACCRLRTTLEDDLMLKHPESMRFCGFQNVSINLPQISYRAGKNNWEGVYKEIDSILELVVKAHQQKKAFIKDMQQPGRPQWQTGKIAPDGMQYVDLDNCTYIVGLVGMNEMIQHQTGKELHELDAKESEEYGLKPIAYMNVKLKELSKKTGLKLSLEESPAESTARRFAKTDLVKYNKDATPVIKGSIERDEVYYTNSIHFRPDAPIDLMARIEGQSKYHSAIDSGAIIHAFVGEKIPPKESIYELIKKTYDTTQAAQLTISPEFTCCKACGKVVVGLKDSCPACNSADVKGITRIVGYYSEIPNWNLSKKGELKDRHKGHYAADDVLEVPKFLQTSEVYNGNVNVKLFGKEGCAKCHTLQGRLEKFVEKQNVNGLLGLQYYDMTTVDGLAESMKYGINPARIPAVVVENRNGIAYRKSTNYDSKNPMDAVITEKDFGPTVTGLLEAKH